ncbi:MAG: NAD-dependent epimerase/dehydratase family protein [Ilumatobacteraceae bacterium]
MNVFVTGANGFLGSAVVRALRACGHGVVALVRTATSAPAAWASDEGISVVQGDLRVPAAWAPSLAGVEAVVHLAAAKAGDFHEQFAQTVGGTEQLLSAMSAAGVRRLVHVSTFSVYEYLAPPAGSRLDERSALETNPTARDDYAQTKLVQEQLVRAFDGEVVIIRPGLIYGPDAWWNAGRAMRLAGNWWLQIAPEGVLNLTHVDNCADAIALAVTAEAATGATINIVDDELPTRRQYERMLRDAGLDTDRSLPVPYPVAAFGASLLHRINARWFAGRAKLPGVAVPAKQAARFKPFTYDHAAATRLLGWRPRVSLAEAIGAAKVAPVDSADVPHVAKGR